MHMHTHRWTHTHTDPHTSIFDNSFMFFVLPIPIMYQSAVINFTFLKSSFPASWTLDHRPPPLKSNHYQSLLIKKKKIFNSITIDQEPEPERVNLLLAHYAIA